MRNTFTVLSISLAWLLASGVAAAHEGWTVGTKGELTFEPLVITPRCKARSLEQGTGSVRVCATIPDRDASSNPFE